MINKAIMYAVEIKETEYLFIYPTDPSLNPFKICYSAYDSFKQRHGREWEGGDIYVMFTDRTKAVVTREEYAQLDQSVGFIMRRAKTAEEIAAEEAERTSWLQSFLVPEPA